jgi:hypothetical protein
MFGNWRGSVKLMCDHEQQFKEILLGVIDKNKYDLVGARDWYGQVNGASTAVRSTSKAAPGQLSLIHTRSS